MSTIQELFQQAQLAEAAYANLTSAIGDQAILKQALDVANNDQYGGSFSQAQATEFVTHWRVVDQYTAPSGMFGLTDGTGFSATVFESLDTPGQYSFSMRGTQPGYSDLSADIGDIVADGIAIDQVIEMYNYWKSLTCNTVAYQAAYLETLTAETLVLKTLWAQTLLPTGPSIYANYVGELQAAGIIVEMGPLGPSAQRIAFGDSNFVLPGSYISIGLGKLSGSATVDVAGHSLGGHLAMAFSRLFPSATTEVVAVNGAGFQFNNGNVDVLFSRLGGTPGFDTGKITNAVGSAAMNLVSQDWLFLQQPAGRTEIYTESAGASAVFGHGSGQMTDSLAVYNLFAQLDPALNIDPNGLQTITDILKASANVEENTLESAITDLGRLFNVAAATGFTGSEFDNGTAGRDLLYNAIAGFDSIVNPALSSVPLPTIQSLTSMDAATLAANAQADTATGMAYRYALLELNPFVALGMDYAGLNTNGALALYSPTDSNTTNGMTDQYLADRAAMYAVFIQRNISDSTNVSSDILYFDAASNTILRSGSHATDAMFQQIRFGDAGTNILTGGLQTGTKGVSIKLFPKPPCHVAHALS